jgi:hypothetical protein
MQEAIGSLELTDLEMAVLECILYSDLFDFPLTPDEVWRWLPTEATKDEVDRVLAGEGLARYLISVPPYVALRGREHLIPLRERRSHSSAVLKRTAERYARWIARLPFVRMVALSGSLAVDNSDDGDDLDYLIVVAPGRVWLTRTLTMAVVRIAGVRGATVCPNYLLSEANLALTSQDLYTAHELLQMRPLTGHAVYGRMLTANPWWRDYLPNAAPPVAPAREASLSPVRRAIEALLLTRPFDLLEAWIMRRKGAELRRQAQSDEAVFDETMCKGHFEGWRERSRRSLKERVTALVEGRA